MWRAAMVKDIDAEKLKEWIDSGKDFILIDARDPVNYKKDHLPGARSLLLSDIDKYAGKFTIILNDFTTFHE